VDVPDTLAQLNLLGSPITLRRATRHDLPAIVRLLIDDPIGRTREAVSDAHDSGPYEAAFAAIDTDPAQLLVVATEGIEVVATMQLSFIPGLARRGALRAQAEAVRVATGHRSQGLGAAMFQWAIEEARRLVAQWFSSPRTRLAPMHTVSTNAWASRLHTRFTNCASESSTLATQPCFGQQVKRR
jgi:GNAT superfamily N-acetyltransferase